MTYLNGLKIFIYPYRRTLYFVFFCLILEAIFFSGVNFSFKFIIDALLNRNKSLLELILIFFYSGISLIILVIILRDYLYSWCVANIMRDIREKLLEHLGHLSLEYYIREQNSAIISYFSTSISAMENGMYSFATGAIYPILSLICNLILLSTLSWKLVLVAMLICPFLFMGPNRISSPLFNAISAGKLKENELISIVHEAIISQPVIKAFGLLAYISKRFSKINQNIVGTMIKVNFLKQFVLRWAELSPVFLEGIGCTVVGYMVYQKYISPSVFVAFIMIFTTLIYSLMRMIYFHASFVEAATGIRLIKKFFNEKPNIVDGTEIVSMPKQSKKIAFHHVSFRYQKDELTITDITCTILSGQNVAFVGSSGAGKSTLLNLLMRFYDPSEGSLTLDDIDYRNFTQDSLHSVIGYVPQEPMMFNITIMENIRLGNLAATNEEIFEAAKAAEIHDDIMRMLNGYETMVGERGGRLSSGQKQRIAIARAFLRKPSIFILDEITASLDPASESAINQTIQRITKGLTCIAVTHRLSSVIKSDCIYVIQHGRMCEQGTHKELLAQNGVYKHIWEKQHGFILNYLDNNEAKITANRLSEVPIFQNVSLNILDKITTLFHTYHYEENQIVMEEGELGDLFFIIVHGQVGVYNLNKEKKDKQIAVLSDGDYFGEIALLKAVPRNATIKTMSPCILLTLRHRDFMNLLKEAPELRKKLEEKLILSQISNNHNHGIN